MKKRITLVLCILAFGFFLNAQNTEFDGQSCTSIMVGKKASADGSVITSHTCDGRYRTWVFIEPAANYKDSDMLKIYKGTMHTRFHGDMNGLTLVGEIPQSTHTYAYLNTAYPCLNEKQLAIGETTFSGPDTLVNKNGMFQIEELQRVALMRCDNARDAIKLIGDLIAKYGYGDGGECITIADKHEVWQMEILGEGPDKIGGIWAAQRVPDDHVAVSANIPRIGILNRNDRQNFMASDNIETVAKKYGLWDGTEPFVFWKAFNAAYANGKNFRERELFIFNSLAPSRHFTMEMSELPFSIKPEKDVNVLDVIALFRSTYEGTDMDMTQNIKMVRTLKNKNGEKYQDTITSPVANPWMTNNTLKTLNYLSDTAVIFRRTVAVAWCSYSHIIQLRSWLPDEIGGICWFSVDNPAESPRIPIFTGNTELPMAFNTCGQRQYNDNAIVWYYRKANKLATVSWQFTKDKINENVSYFEKKVTQDLPNLETQIKKLAAKNNTQEIHDLLNAYTSDMVGMTHQRWLELEQTFWMRFGLGF